MARLALKPDSSFFRKIAIGAIGTRAVVDDLAAHGHQVDELERGSTDTKLWKDVKRKRVRIPDLVCRCCGLRIESRAKTKAELYFACAETDIYAPMEIIEKVKQGMEGAKAEVEIFPGTHHGFAFPKRPVYDRDAAERHWERLLALYRRNFS